MGLQWKRVLRRVLRRGSEKGVSRCLERPLGEYALLGGDDFFKMGDEFLDEFYLRKFSLEFSQFRAHSGTKKNPPQNSPPNLCRIRGVSEVGFSQCATHGPEAGTHQHLIKQLAQSLASNAEVPSLDGLCLSSMQADGSCCERNTCSKQNCNNIVFLWISSVSMVHAKGMCRSHSLIGEGAPKISLNSSTMELSYSPTPTKAVISLPRDHPRKSCDVGLRCQKITCFLT